MPTKTPTPTFTPTGTPTRTPTPTPTPFGRESFKGSYSMRFFGKTGGGAPDGGTGIVISDGVGKISGNLTENKDGAVCQFTLNGTYTVNPDGTGSITATGTPITTARETLRFRLRYWSTPGRECSPCRLAVAAPCREP